MNPTGSLPEPPDDFKVIVCIDMDAFYAAAEAIRFGYDETVPVVVAQWAGCIAVSYAARKSGVTRGMRVDEIKRVCPNVVFIHVDTTKLGEGYIDPYKRDLQDKLKLGRDRNKEKVSLDYYRLESDKIISIFRKHCSVVEKASIDESFFDLTEEANEIYAKGEYSKTWVGKIPGAESFQPETKEDLLLMIGSQLTDKIRKEVYTTLKYTCSAGISYNKMLSKVASGMNKPNAQTVIVKKHVQNSLQGVEIPKLRNFGGKVAEAFQIVGLKTLGDIQKLNLEDLIQILKDEHCAKWVYFRCRGFDDEVVEEKDFTNKSLLSHKSFDRTVSNILDLEDIETLVLSDLYSRVLRFYKEKSLVPCTLNLHYYDNKTHERRTKSGPINLKVKEERFFDVLKEKTRDLIKHVADVLFPCKFLGVSAKNFEKNDAKSYGFDLISYAREKQREKDLKLEKERENNKLQSSGAYFGKENEKNLDTFFAEEMNKLQDQLDESFYLNENSATTILTLNKEEPPFEIGCMKEEKIQVEEIQCQKCGVFILAKDEADHADFHIAQELDKELNPNKRKYRKMESGQMIPLFQEDHSLEQELKKPQVQRKKETKEAKKDNQIRRIDSFFVKK